MTAAETVTEPDVVTKLSPRPVTETVTRLTGLLAAKGMKVFAVIDQRAEALGAGLDLRETTLVIFGNPVGGTPVMAAAPLAALDGVGGRRADQGQLPRSRRPGGPPSADC
jgi:uncharacterized protein (DUF302 family)